MSVPTFDAERTFFTADTHFNHYNILHFCRRPYNSSEEMDSALIENWNRKVGPEDHIFHLGDFAFGGSLVWTSILGQLNGRIHLILGNHDLKNIRQGYMKMFEEVAFQKVICINSKTIVLNHFPFLCYGGDRHGVVQLYGHVHSGPNSTGYDIPKLQYLSKYQYDVGVDNNEYEPKSFAEIQKIMGIE